MSNFLLRMASLIAYAPPMPLVRPTSDGHVPRDIMKSNAAARRFTASQLGVHYHKGITAAEQKRRSLKRRNRARHKAHLRRKSHR